MPKYGIKTSFQTGGTSMAELPWWQAPYIVIFHLAGLLNCAGTHTHIPTDRHTCTCTDIHAHLIVDCPAYPPEFPTPPLLNEKAVEARDRSSVKERVSMLTLYWKLLLYGVPCIMTCYTHWQEALTTFWVALLQELHYSCCHIYITLDPDSDHSDNSYAHLLIQA